MTAAGANAISDAETGPRGRARALVVLAAVTLLLHLPFLFQPVQGDEGVYLDTAREALKHPLAPLNFPYVFQGNEVNMAGHPHPPLNAWFLALLLLVGGGVSEPFFHAAYLVFPLLAAYGGYLLAERFTARPLWAALLLAAAPLVQVNTNTLASPEAPAIAFLLLGAAYFVRRRFLPAGVFLVLAGMTALQALAIAPILLLDFYLRGERPPRAAWLAVAAPFVVLAAWQLSQLAIIGRLPASILFGYTTTVFGGIKRRVWNALALTEHLAAFVVFTPLLIGVRKRVAAQLRQPALWVVIVAGIALAVFVPGYAAWERAMLAFFFAAGVGTLAWLWHARRDEPFLAAWCLAYFAFTLVAFFAGAARYLLPLAAPLVLLFLRACENRQGRLIAALAVNLVVGLNISYAAYGFARVYTRVPPPSPAPFLVNGEWGFRYYLVEKGGRPIQRASVPAVPGEWIVSSELSLAGKYGSLAESVAVPVRTLELGVRSPLRLVDRYGHSGFSSAAFGLLPFSFSRQPLDRITYWRTSPFLKLDTPWVPTQFSGRFVYLPRPGAAVRLPIDPSWSELHFALFAAHPGRASFSIRDARGNEIFRRDVAVAEGLWEIHNIPVEGRPELLLRVEAPAEMCAGWGELIAF
jgi:hypothetical protein